jgi:hypothetical protein
MSQKKRGAERAPQTLSNVLPDNTEAITPSLARLQASKLIRLYAVNASMAEALAPLIFLEALR